MKPQIPSSLDSEEKVLWTGWYSTGDREVVREAAVKGTISLALKFLAIRKELDNADVERWLKTEVLAWVHLLLLRKQVFKASHILNNVGIDPAKQLTISLSEATDTELRDYIAEHLLKIGKLDESIEKTWRFLKLIEKYNHNFNLLQNIDQISINKFDQLDIDFKNEIATQLFFYTYDFCLDSFLKPDSCWKFLLETEKFEILQIWIRIYFSQDLNFKISSKLDLKILNKLKNLFLLWPITDIMINDLNDSIHSKFIKNYIFDELAHFGIFNNYERNDIQAILTRFIKTGNVNKIFTILDEPNAIIKSDFYEKLALFCLKNNLMQVLSVCLKNYEFSASSLQKINAKEFNLYLSVNETLNNLENETIFYKNILLVSQYFAENNLNGYFKENPYVLLALIYFHGALNDILYKNVATDFTGFTISKDLFLTYIKNFTIFQNIIENCLSNQPNSVSLEDLLSKNTNFGCILQYNAQNSLERPFYMSATSYDFVNELNYLYYIKQLRPNQAFKVFYIDQFTKHKEINELEKFEKGKIVQTLAIKNCTNPKIVASCIVFLEMIGFSSDYIRVLADIVKKLNKSNKFSEPELMKIAYENPRELLNLIETHLDEKYSETSFSCDSFVDTMLENKVPVKFSRLNGLELPEHFLIYCAKQNLWLPFLIFAQLNGYPLEQVIHLTSCFENENLCEHLHHALSKDISCSNLLESDDNFMVKSYTSQYSVNSVTSDINFELPVTNLLTILIKCHKSEDPPNALLLACQKYRYPLLAVLATCYEPDSVVINWITWLSISCNIKLDIIENYAVSANTVSYLLIEVIRKKYVRTALESFEIFMPNHLFCHLLEFLNLCITYDFEKSKKHLNEFEAAVSQLKFNLTVLQNDFEYMFLNNGYWIVETSIKLIFATVGNCFRSLHQKITFLNLLCKSNLTKSIPTECPNFCKISMLLESMSYTNINLDLSNFWNPAERKTEIVRCIEVLVDNKNFKYALELAKFEKILKEYVLNAEWSFNFQNERTDSFWADCDTAFQKSNILPISAAEFFVNCCKELKDYPEKYKALKCAYSWLKKSDYSDPYVENIEQEIWSNYFSLDDETLKGSHYEKHETNYLLSDLQENSITKSKFEHHLSIEQVRHFEETIGKILESGDIIEALRLEKMFNYKHEETSMLLTCYELAEGKMSPYQLSTEQRIMYMNRDKNLKSALSSRRRRTQKSSRFSHMSTSSYSSTNTDLTDANVEHSDQDTLNLLETMTDRLTHGSNIANRILMCYRISLNTNKPYKSIVQCRDSYSLLRTALDNDCTNKLEVISDILLIFKWSKKEVINFICDEITKAIYKSFEQNLEHITMWDLQLDNNFHLILQIANEYTSKLGEKLLKRANNIHQNHSQSSLDINKDDINVIIEILIRAHDCFTAECNMEGISCILRKAQTLTSTILNLKDWNLMVRLLTGIGRYTEMNYIFQILKENDQFEYLLKKGHRNDNNLKVALLKFLKTNCPKNQKLFQMVALRFTLYSEVAEMFENEANEVVETLIETSRLEMQNRGYSRVQQFVLFTKNDSTNVCLKKAMDNFTHAAEYHLHGDKYMKAMICANQAELIALQMAMLKIIPDNEATKCILHIDKNQVQNLIHQDLSFPHARILIEAYNYVPDWGTILYNRCILNSDIIYLNEFVKLYPLNNTLVQDVTRKFLSENIQQPSCIKTMKDMILKLDNVQMKYRISSELGFTDVIESLLSDNAALAFLKDTVWKKGFKQT